MSDLDPSNIWSLKDPHKSPNNGISIGSAVFFCSAHSCDRHTDKHTDTECWQCGIKITVKLE